MSNTFASSHGLTGYLYIFSGIMSIQILYLFLNEVIFFVVIFFVELLLRCNSSFYILDTRPLSDMIWK